MCFFLFLTTWIFVTFSKNIVVWVLLVSGSYSLSVMNCQWQQWPCVEKNSRLNSKKKRATVLIGGHKQWAKSIFGWDVEINCDWSFAGTEGGDLDDRMLALARSTVLQGTPANADTCRSVRGIYSSFLRNKFHPWTHSTVTVEHDLGIVTHCCSQHLSTNR